jgi:membrane fusion protein, multidrug efflux system
MKHYPTMSYAAFWFLLLSVFVVSCNKPSKPKPPPPNVATAVVEQRDVPIYVDAIGQAISPVTVQITPQAGGKLTAVYMQQGAIVKEGDILYSIDPRPYQALLDQSKAQLKHDIALHEYAKRTVERYKTVVENDFIALLTFEQYLSNEDSAKAQVELDVAAVRAAQINLDYCTIQAPISGKISSYTIDVGNVVTVNDATAITIIRPFSPIDISFSLPQQQLEMIRAVQGNEGKWKFIALLEESPKNKVEGTTYFIDNQVDQNTGTILLKGRLPNVTREFWPGEFVKVQVLYKVAPNALVVPPGAVLMGNKGAYLYTVDKDNKAVAHNVTVLIRTNEYIAVDSKEVHKGDIVITDGQINIAPGVLVHAAQMKSEK